MQDRRLGRRTVSQSLFLAVLLHNLEEALTYGASREEATQLARSVWPEIQLPTVATAQLSLLLLTAAVGVGLAWAARTGRAESGWLVLRVVAAILLANVMIPHVPAAIAFGGYSPGVITAVAVNLPLSLWILLQRSGPTNPPPETDG